MDANENLMLRFELVEVDDAGELQTVRGQGRKNEMFGGKKFKVPRMQNYGHSINPPKGSIGVAFALNGNLDQVFVAWCEHPTHRPTSQEPGESQLYDDQGQYIKIARDKIDIKTPLPVNVESDDTITLKAPTIILDGVCKIGGPDAANAAGMLGSLDSALQPLLTQLATKVFLK